MLEARIVFTDPKGLVESMVQHYWSAFRGIERPSFNPSDQHKALAEQYQESLARHTSTGVVIDSLSALTALPPMTGAVTRQRAR